MKIWKYPIQPLAVNEFPLCEHDVPISFITRPNGLQMYVEKCVHGPLTNMAEGQHRTVTRRFAAFPTGTGEEHGVPQLDHYVPIRFIGSAEMYDRIYIFHLFEIE